MNNCLNKRNLPKDIAYRTIFKLANAVLSPEELYGTENGYSYANSLISSDTAMYLSDMFPELFYNDKILNDSRVELDNLLNNNDSYFEKDANRRINRIKNRLRMKDSEGVFVHGIRIGEFDRETGEYKVLLNNDEIINRIGNYKPSQTIGDNPTFKYFALTDYPIKVGVLAMFSWHYICGGCQKLRVTPDGEASVCLADENTYRLKDLPLKEKTILSVFIAKDLIDELDASGAASVLEIDKLFKGLMSYVVNLNVDIGELEKTFVAYDYCHEYNLVDAILKVCEKVIHF